MTAGRRPACLAIRLLLALLVPSLLGGNMAQAARYTYSITGDFDNSTGPGKSQNKIYNGSFKGTFTWDTEANQVGLTSWLGGWSDWTINMPSDPQSPAQPTNVFTFASSNAGKYQDMSDSNTIKTYSLNSAKGADAGCFASPLASAANAASGARYALSAAGKPVCQGGSQVTNAYDTVQTNQGRPDVFSVYQITNVNEPYSWDAGSGGSGRYNYFRIPLSTSSDFTSTGVLSTGSYNSDKDAYGWSNLPLDPANGSATPVACKGDNSNQNNPPPAGSCPFAGNTQLRSSIDTLSISLDNCEDGAVQKCPPSPGPSPSTAPTPLPILGSVLALGWSKRLRRRIQLQAA